MGLLGRLLLKNNSFQEVLDFDKIYNQKLDELIKEKAQTLKLLETKK